MKTRILNLILILFLNLFLNPLFGQEDLQEQTLKFKHFSISEGLSQSSTLCILQDTNGFLWFGTRDGLNKYDGYSFKTYRYDSQDENTLSNSFIRSLFLDKKGNVWVGTFNGLNKYLPEKDSFDRVKLPYQETIKSNLEIWSIAQEDDEHIWLGTNYGLDKFNINTYETPLQRKKSQNSNSLSSNEIRFILKTSNGDLWICSTKNIDVYSPDTNTFRSYEYSKNYLKEEKSTNLPRLYEDKDNNLWLGYKNGLAIFNKVENAFEPFKLDEISNISEIKDEVRAIKSDYLGNLWVGTYKGLYVVDNDRSKIKYYSHDENDVNSLSQNSIYDIFEDNKGDIWIGTYAGGINYYDRSFDVFKNFSAGTNNFKLNYKVISSIIETKDNLWIATEGGGINLLDKNTKQFSYITHDKNNNNSLSANNVKSIIRTKKGNFWIGTHDGGLNFLNPNKLPFKFERFKNNREDSTSISNDRVISLLEDANDNIWIGTSGGGFNVLDFKTKKVKRFVDASNIVGMHVYMISKSQNKNILYIGGDKGLIEINIHDLTFTPIIYKEKNKDSFNKNPTLDVYEDEKRNLWIATEGDGLFYYDVNTRKSIKYGNRQGLPSEVVYTILPDELNNIWLSTNYGLSSLNLRSKFFKNYDTSDGLIGNEFNYGSSLKLKNGNLMFGGAGGLNFFNPKDIDENSFIPQVLVTSILVNNKPYLSENTDKKEISLEHDQNVFSFNFVALSYSHPNKNQYAYKLEGFDKDWNYIGNKKSATYTNLDAGDYVFKIKASNSDGLWNEKGDTVIVKIKPAPWKTWWAYLLYTLFVIGALFLIRKYSLLRINEKNELKQERLEKKQMEELNQMKLKLFTNISHDFRTPLTLIIGPLERLIQKKEGNTFIQSQLKSMHRNASVLLQLINQLLDFRKSDSGKLKLKFSKQNMVPFIENIKLSFDELAIEKEIKYSINSSEKNIEVWFDNINLKKIIYNLLSNAFKYTPDKGEISIKLSTKKKPNRVGVFKNYVEIIVKNSGKGISKENIKLMFERFYQLDQNENTRASGTGIGLALTKSLVELHYGKIKVKSKVDEFTKLIIQLPLGNEHLMEDEIINQNIESNSNDSFLIKNLHQINKEIKLESNKEVKSFNNSLSTLLLVEDNEEVRLFIKNLFEKDNNILEAENGEKALEIINSNEIDLIISDVMMPVMDGITLCEKVKSNIQTSHIPVILLTAKTSEESQKSAYTTGADAYITKPFNANVLEIRVSNLLKSRKNLVSKFKKELILQPKDIAVTSTDELFLKKAIDILEENLTNSDFSINEFIEKMGMSRSVLYRKLKALTGQSIFEFIRTIKLKRAAQLIIKSDLTISEVAYDLGFNDLKYFRKHFKLLFNELPSQYRINQSKLKEE